MKNKCPKCGEKMLCYGTFSTCPKCTPSTGTGYIIGYDAGFYGCDMSWLMAYLKTIPYDAGVDVQAGSGMAHPALAAIDVILFGPEVPWLPANLSERYAAVVPTFNLGE